jgi:hypothetical protein
MGPMMPAFGDGRIVFMALAAMLFMVLLIAVGVVALTLWHREPRLPLCQ